MVERSTVKLRKRSQRGEKDNPYLLLKKLNSRGEDFDWDDMEEKERVKKTEEVMI